jgi:signal transduction histidine kinase
MGMASRQPRSTPSERHLTDRSLAVERRKTDRELAKRAGELEQDTDHVVAAARVRADENLARARANADEQIRTDGETQGRRATLLEERVIEDDLLRRERACGDDKISSERHGRRRAIAAMLARERAKTDQDLMVERHRADHAIGSRDEFLAIVSHDLRNLLGALAMSAASLKYIKCDDEIRDSIDGNAERIQRYAGRMNRLLGDLLDVVSIEAGRLAVLPRRQDAVELLRETVDVFQPIAAAKMVTLDTEMKEGSLLARYDYERILQVLANLVGNAIKFTGEGGRIHILVKRVANDVEFAVTDSGIGIEPNKLSLVFERFWKTVDKDRTGLGLGLYISKCIVEAHGGKLWAESRMGKGSTFYFTLPAAR